MIANMIARLGTEVSALKSVGEAADFQAASDKNPNVGPAAYVFSTGDSAPASGAIGVVRQKVTETVAVVYAVRNVTSKTGAGNSASMRSLSQDCRKALIGWQPDAGCDPLEFVSGNLLAFRDGWQWWMDTFRTKYTLNQM